ncbi:MAG: ABC transporter substrate-binding protein [Gammaproteobacteria bacterium]
MSLPYAIEPFRIGMMQDWGTGIESVVDGHDATRLAFEEAHQSGLIERPVEFDVFNYDGPPFGLTDTVIDRWRDYVAAKRPIAMIGPRQTDNAIQARKAVEQLQIPTISDCGTLLFPDRYCFCLPNGTFCDEAVIMVDYLKRQGCRSFALVAEDNPIGEEYARFVRPAARRAGLTIRADRTLAPIMSEAEVVETYEGVKRSGAEGLMYVGFGAAACRFFKAVRADGYDRPRVTMSIFMATASGIGEKYGFDMPGDFEGWAGIDQYDERNEHFVSFLERFEKRFGRRPVHCYAPLAYDTGRVLAEALAMAKPLSRDGLRDALERVRMLPAATGSPGTHISFAPYEHRGFKGPYIVLRQIRGGRNVPV